MNLDGWLKSELERTMTIPEPERDWSLGLSSGEWPKVYEGLPALASNAKPELDKRVAAGLMTKIDGAGKKPSLYRLADDATWAKVWPELKALLEAKR